MSQVDTSVLVLINLLLLVGFGRLYFGSFVRPLIVVLRIILNPRSSHHGLRRSGKDMEPSELLFFFFCVMFLAGELLWLSKF